MEDVLGIGYGSLSSSCSEEQSDEQSQSSKEAEVCTSSASGKDRFKKRTYHATTMQDFFAKRPKLASSHLPSVIIANDEETSQKVTRPWTDHCKISSSGKSLLKDFLPQMKDHETLFLFESFCKHHSFDRHKQDNINAVTVLVNEAGDRCEWSAIANQIARDHPKEFGAEHLCCDICQQALKTLSKLSWKLGLFELCWSSTCYQEALIAMIVATVTAMVGTYAITFTISLLQPIVLGVIAAAGCAQLLTDGGKGRFNCSRRWLAELFRKHNLLFRKQQ